MDVGRMKGRSAVGVWLMLSRKMDIERMKEKGVDGEIEEEDSGDRDEVNISWCCQATIKGVHRQDNGERKPLKATQGGEAEQEHCSWFPCYHCL
jgi:hypothetical protein